MAQNTDIVEIAQAVEDKLMALLGQPDTGIIKSRAQIRWGVDEMPHVEGDFDIVLRIRRMQRVATQDHGGRRDSHLGHLSAIDQASRTMLRAATASAGPHTFLCAQK